tara:strand:- start:688 stop:1749 length:1062 start_codon:yes stop_codon:yes gene_type:complete
MLGVMNLNRVTSLLLIIVIIGCGNDSSGDGQFAVADSAHNERTIVVDGLTSPRGLVITDDGRLLVAETGGGRLIEVAQDRTSRSLTEKRLPHSLNTGPDAAYRAGPSAISLLNDDIYFIVGEFRGSHSARMFRLGGESEFEPVTPATDPQASLRNRFSNPYDIVDAPEVNGWIISDPGGNSLVKVDIDGNIHDYVVFENFSIPDHEVPIEMVPTGISRGPDNAVYVGFLTGFPYPNGEAAVWRVEDLNNDGDAMDEGETELYATGFTTITDITFGPDGTMYVAEFSTNTKDVFSGGDYSVNSVAHPGRVLKWENGTTTVIASSAVSPTGILATETTLYISEEYAGIVTELPLD